MVLRDFITVLKPTFTKDAQGGAVETLAPYWQGWAKVEQQSFRQAMEQGQPTSEKPIKVIIRKNEVTEQIDGSYILTYKAKSYKINMAAREIDPMYLELLATAQTI